MRASRIGISSSSVHATNMAERVLYFFLAVSTAVLQITWGCPQSTQETAEDSQEATRPSVLSSLSVGKAAYKSGEHHELLPAITLSSIKNKLRDTGIFDYQDPQLNDRERKELGKLFDAIEIMTTSRARQPSNVQSVFSSLRLVERVVKKQLKEGQISDSLADKFHWDKLQTRTRREQPMYRLDKEAKMRIFNVNV